MPEQKTILLHLTKTAGGTLKRALSETEGLNVSFLYNQADVDAAAAEDHDPIDLFYGHVMFGVHERLGLNDARYICFMRHPVTRTISHYYHLRNVEEGPVGEEIRASEDINDFFKNHQHWEFSNFMVKIISGYGPKVPEGGIGLFQKAQENINTRFDFIGFQEYFPLSLRKLSHKLGKKIEIKEDINIGRYSFGDVSENTLAKIEEINRADIELYKFCLNKFL